MAKTADILNSLVSVTQFNKGQASKNFDRLSEIEEEYRLLLLAQKRISNGGLDKAVPFSEAMAELGISENEINEAEDLEIE